MSSSFPRTMRALHMDGMNPTVLALILISATIALWCGWVAFGRVSVSEVSARARLEMERVHPVAPAVGGRVVASYLTLGREVRSGDVLVEIEADREELETTEERTRLTALTLQVSAIGNEIVAEEQAIALANRAARAALAEASQKLAAIQAAAKRAADQHARMRHLAQQGLVSEADLDRSEADADQQRADAAAARLGVERLRAEQVTAERERRGHFGAIVRERVTLEGERAAVAATVTRREREADERRIRAPVDGRLAEIAPLQIGAVIQQGERLASIVPNGQLKAVAEFLPTALGRLRPGQPARLRLDGFPWAQYGYVPATVQKVASETREGRVRVELTLDRSPSDIPLEHGLPGVAEVEVERVAPVALLIRTLGQPLRNAAVRQTPDGTQERDGR